MVQPSRLLIKLRTSHNHFLSVNGTILDKHLSLRCHSGRLSSGLHIPAVNVADVRLGSSSFLVNCLDLRRSCKRLRIGGMGLLGASWTHRNGSRDILARGSVVLRMGVNSGGVHNAPDMSGTRGGGHRLLVILATEGHLCKRAA